MTRHDIPKGVSLDTLHEILAGWSDAGAAEEPQYTADVEAETSVSDVVGRQTRFLEELGVLEPHKQRHELTDAGSALAGALAEGEEERAKGQARELLSEWELTDDVRGILEENPMDGEKLVPLVAGVAGQDLETSRVETGVTTLFDLYEWAGVLERDADGRYRLPAAETAAEEGDLDTEAVTQEAVAEIAEYVAREIAAETGGEEGEEPTEGATPSESESTAEPNETAKEGETPESEEIHGEENADAAESELATLADAEDAPELVAELVDATEEAKEAARDAEAAAEEARSAAEAVSGDAEVGEKAESHAISLDLDVDPEDLEAIVQGVRRGLTEE